MQYVTPDLCDAYPELVQVVEPMFANFGGRDSFGGEIVTVGSDAHRCNRVGQYTFRACDILKDIFGYVCTFENRQPVFHKL